MLGTIYIIKNNINEKVYIGKTIVSVAKRWQAHLTSSKTEDTKFYRAIRKYGKENFYYEILEQIDESLLNERECYWIQQYNSKENGYNSTLGGDGSRQLDYEKIKKLWEEGKDRIEIHNLINYALDSVSKVLKECYNIDENEIIRRGYERNQNAPTIDILLKWKEGYTVNKISEITGVDSSTIKKRLFENNITEEDIQKRRIENHRERQCALSDIELLDLWNQGLSIGEISRKYGGAQRTITKRLTELGITQKDKEERKRQTCNQNAKSVVQLTLDNQYIQTFPSARQAGLSLNKPYTSINGCCNHKPKYKTAYGFKWMFETEYKEK